jgi:hypothetical protein
MNRKERMDKTSLTIGSSVDAIADVSRSTWSAILKSGNVFLPAAGLMQVGMRIAQAGSPLAAHDNLLMQQSPRPVLGRMRAAASGVWFDVRARINREGPLDGK